jgi:hypothetical protein
MKDEEEKKVVEVDLAEVEAEEEKVEEPFHLMSMPVWTVLSLF